MKNSITAPVVINHIIRESNTTSVLPRLTLPMYLKPGAAYLVAFAV